MDGEVAIKEFNRLVDRNLTFDKELDKYVDLNEDQRPRLDDFYWKTVGIKEDLKHLWSVIRKTLTLSHGNATVSSIELLHIGLYYLWFIL